MAEPPRVPPSVYAALDFLEWSRTIEQGDGTLPGREMSGEENQTRRAALALLLGYFKRVDPVHELGTGKSEAGTGEQGDRVPANL